MERDFILLFLRTNLRIQGDVTTPTKLELIGRPYFNLFPIEQKLRINMLAWKAHFLLIILEYFFCFDDD